MGIYNFQSRFAPYILDGSKTHTIRAKRKHPDKPGNTLHMYTGLRTKNCKLLGRFVCSKVEDVWIAESRGSGHLLISISCNPPLTLLDVESLALADGFRGPNPINDFVAFFRGRCPFSGDIIHWLPGEKKVDQGA